MAGQKERPLKVKLAPWFNFEMSTESAAHPEAHRSTSQQPPLPHSATTVDYDMGNKQELQRLISAPQ